MADLLLHISDEQAAELDRLSQTRHMTREQIAEQAVTQYLAPEHKPHPLDFFGTLPHLESGGAYQQKMRDESDPDWKPEHLPTWEDAVGLLKGSPEDGLAFQERMRKEWDRNA